MVEIRAERPGEAAAIERVHTLGFGQPDEARLVRRLRAEGYTTVSMAAVDGAEIVGHVLFSRLSAPCLETASLAPVAVLPRGIEACRSSAMDVALVVGEPGYYTRFGFSLAVGSQFVCPWSGPYFLGLELQPGRLGSGTYAVAYPAPFQDL